MHTHIHTRSHSHTNLLWTSRRTCNQNHANLVISRFCGPQLVTITIGMAAAALAIDACIETYYHSHNNRGLRNGFQRFLTSSLQENRSKKTWNRPSIIVRMAVHACDRSCGSGQNRSCGSGQNWSLYKELCWSTIRTTAETYIHTYIHTHTHTYT